MIAFSRKGYSMYLIPIFFGFVLDLIIGDPYRCPHPIRLIGTGISKGEIITRKIFPKTSRGEYLAGLCLSIIILLLSFLVPALILYFAFKISVWLAIALETFMCYQLIAMKCLKNESCKVYAELMRDDLDSAREKVSMIVGRDTGFLDKGGITKATVETVAENTSDGVIAPLLFMSIGGAPLAFFYKAVNTLDSMIGYKNEKYLNFGRFAAKLDDVLNFIPARFSAYLMIAASWILNLNPRNAYMIYRRDRFNHASPNSAQTEAVCAGALGIQLAGNAYYFGKLYEKPTIGDANREIETEDIRRTNRLLYSTAFLCIPFCLAIRLGVCSFIGVIV